MKLVQWEEFKI